MDSGAVKEIAKLAQAGVSDIGGTQFHVNTSGATAIEYPQSEIRTCFSLTQLISLIKLNTDPMITGGKPQLVVNVESWDKVTLSLPALNANKAIEVLGVADFSKMYTPFDFVTHHSQEQFVIGVLSKFMNSAERGDLLAMTKSVKAEKIGTSDDDGISQVASTKSGVHLSETMAIRNVWTLQPYKTFPEVEQPLIPYLLRLHQKDCEMPKFALYECDGGNWKVQTTIAIKDWLQQVIKVELAEKANQVVIL